MNPDRRVEHANTWEQAIAESRPLTEDEASGPIFSTLKDGVPTLTTILVGPGETADEIRARWAREALVDEVIEEILGEEQ